MRLSIIAGISAILALSSASPQVLIQLAVLTTAMTNIKSCWTSETARTAAWIFAKVTRRIVFPEMTGF